jgi:AraC-like DNA-binding protein
LAIPGKFVEMRAKLCLERPPRISAMAIPRHGEDRLLDDYLLPEHWCFHIYSYHATLELNRQSVAIRPGTVSLVPPGVRMIYRYSGPSEHVYFHFKPEPGGRTIDVPMVFDLGDQYRPLDLRARQAVESASLNEPFATATLWSLLWDATKLALRDEKEAGVNGHPIVAAAVRHIEQRLDTSMSIAQLSREVGVSYGYLTRLFGTSLGMPVSEYIRRRRADRAEHLLRSTTLPIKVIARSVGVPNLQRFNRLMNETKGAGPRIIRIAGAKREIG